MKHNPILTCKPTILDILTILVVLLLFISAPYLPACIGYENGWIENAQVLLLLIANLFFLFRSHQWHSYYTKGCGFLLLVAAFREVSWGRTLLLAPHAFTTIGPIFPRYTEPMNTLTHGIAMGLVLIGLYFIGKRFRWEHFTNISFPITRLLLIIVLIVLGNMGEHHSFHAYTYEASQIIEEGCEIMVYVLGISIVYHYIDDLHERYVQMP